MTGGQWFCLFCSHGPQVHDMTVKPPVCALAGCGCKDKVSTAKQDGARFWAELAVELDEDAARRPDLPFVR